MWVATYRKTRKFLFLDKPALVPIALQEASMQCNAANCNSKLHDVAILQAISKILPRFCQWRCCADGPMQLAVGGSLGLGICVEI